MALLLIVAMLAEIALGLREQGTAAIPTLLGVTTRLLGIAGLLWGAGDLAILLIDIGHDVRAARIDRPPGRAPSRRAPRRASPGVGGARAEDMTDAGPVYTIGHSTRMLSRVPGASRREDIRHLVDVRRFPVSRRHPHFDAQPLAALSWGRIPYEHAVDLGGRRAADAGSRNLGWRNTSFRGYADHMARRRFGGARTPLVAAERAPTAIMCAGSRPMALHPDVHRRRVARARTGCAARPRCRHHRPCFDALRDNDRRAGRVSRASRVRSLSRAAGALWAVMTVALRSLLRHSSEVGPCSGPSRSFS